MAKIKNILPVIVLGLLVASLTAKSAQAADNGWYPPIIQKLVEKFGLNENDVKAVFDEQRTQRQNQMQSAYEDRLNQAVADGKINQEQKQKILDKHNELKNQAGQNRQELKTWAEQNGIDIKYLFGFGKFGTHKG